MLTFRAICSEANPARARFNRRRRLRRLQALPDHDQHDGTGDAQAREGDGERVEDQAEHLPHHALLDGQHRPGLAAAIGPPFTRDRPIPHFTGSIGVA
jgi:hypothetical protein